MPRQNQCARRHESGSAESKCRKSKKTFIVIYDSDSFQKKDLEKAGLKTDNPFQELNLNSVQAIPVAITSLTKQPWRIWE